MPRILIVDDSEDLAELYRTMLVRDGHVVATALDGATGLRLVSEFRPDVVVLDMMMPELDGLEFLSALPAACSPPLPRVIATSDFDTYRGEAMRRGAHTFLRKPIDRGVLRAAIAATVPGAPMPTASLVENLRQAEALREYNKSAASAVLAQLAVQDTTPLHASFQALVDWLQHYYGFGQCFLHVLEGESLCLRAAAGNDPHWMAPGMRYDIRKVYCEYVITAGSALLVSDPLRHPVDALSHHEVVRVRGWHFYLGAPLVTADGAVLGTLCLMDRTPREMHAEDVALFEALAREVAAMLAECAAGHRVEHPIIDSERVFRRTALELLIGTSLRRTARTNGRLELTRITLRDRADYAFVARTAHGLTGGLRFAMVAVRKEELVMFHDGADPAIVFNNQSALQRCVAPALRALEVRAWSASELPIGVGQPLPSQTVHAIAAHLLERVGVSALAVAA
jgi:CheY-like chemotaxis protein